MRLLLYHGSDCAFDEIDLKRSQPKRDFGVGFYTTTIATQAENWARSKKNRNLAEHAVVQVYEAELCDELRIKAYEGMTEEWLETIRRNRLQDGVQHSYDVMIGPAANDNTMMTVSRYLQGIYTVDEAIERLRYSKANDQISFHTERAVRCLRLVRRYYAD